MLVISQSSFSGESQPSWPEDRFAKISQAIKLFRLGCKYVGSRRERPWAKSARRRLRSEFRTMEIKQHGYTAIFDEFTPKSYIMIVSTDSELGEYGQREVLIRH